MANDYLTQSLEGLEQELATATRKLWVATARQSEIHNEIEDHRTQIEGLESAIKEVELLRGGKSLRSDTPFGRFEALTKMLVTVPKSEIQHEAERYEKDKSTSSIVRLTL